MTDISKSSAYNNCGLSNFENENYDQAIKDFTSAMKKSGETSNLFPGRNTGQMVGAHYNNRGLAYYYNGENVNAMSDFEQAVLLDSRDPNCRYNRGNVYLNLNQFAQAHLDFDSAIKIQPTNPKFYHAKGLAYEAEAIHVEVKMLANPPEARLDAQGYPVADEDTDVFSVESGVEEAKSPLLPNRTEQNKLIASAPNQESGRVKMVIYPIVQRAIKCYYEAMNQDENFLQSRFHAALML